MNSVDPLSASLYFSAAASASKEASKGQGKEKADKARRASFSSLIQKSHELEELASSGLPPEIAGLSTEDAVVFLKDAVDIAGDALVQQMDGAAFAEFRKAVGQFLRYIEKNNYEVSKIKRFGMTRNKRGPFFAETRPRDPYVQVRVVDRKLDEIATMILQNQADRFKLLSRVDEIKGLLVDFFAA
ncbi:MAG: YaaR family protein [Treponemataceae bacterium]|nr:YaaR family protein [Treponemataceae bacterium]